MMTINFVCVIGLFAVLQAPCASAFQINLNEDVETEKSNDGGVTVQQSVQIVNKHNELRRDVRPSASNMLKVSWNKEAAANAQKWATACNIKHSPPNTRIIKGGIACGENLFSSTTELPWNKVIQAWYDEVKDFKYGEGSVNGADIEHYTQVVWYGSHMVGCGLGVCPDAEYEFFYVCQYCPAGNLAGKISTPYKSGSSCGDCPNHCDNKLCTNPCVHADKYSNCKELVEEYECSHPSVAKYCPASCKCTHEIV